MFGFGVWEILVVGVVALLIFGKRIPGLARSLGQGVVGFKEGLSGSGDEPTTAGGKALEQGVS
jgi:sec-independent protein translocase protein TatA